MSRETLIRELLEASAAGRVSELLAKIISAKDQIQAHGLVEWATRESIGYAAVSHDEVPEYRLVLGQYYRSGGQRLPIRDSSGKEVPTRLQIEFPLVELEALAANSDHVKLTSPDINHLLQQAFGAGSYEFRLSPSALQSVVQRIRIELLSKLSALLKVEPIEEATVSASHPLSGHSDARKVFLVHGRDAARARGMRAFLSSLDLAIIEWTDAIALTGKPSADVWEIIQAGMNAARAIVVLFTADDEVQLRQEHRKPEDLAVGQSSNLQARPNVIFEAGAAMMKWPERTVLVEIAPHQMFSDLRGVHTVRFDGSIGKRQELRDKLAIAQCELKPRGDAWHSAGQADFDAASRPPIATPTQKKAARPSTLVGELGELATPEPRPVSAPTKSGLLDIAFQYPGAVEEFLTQYYSRGKSVFPLQISTQSRSVLTRTFSRPNWLSAQFPINGLSETFVQRKSSLEKHAGIEARRLALESDVRQAFQDGRVKLTNNKTYVLHNANGDLDIRAPQFSSIDFLQARFSEGLLDDELQAALRKCDGDVARAYANRDSLCPLRGAWLPTRRSLVDLARRDCVGGIAIVLALPKPAMWNHFLIPVYKRSEITSASRGLWTVSGTGFHQYYVDPRDEVRVRWTVLREIGEELLGYTDLESFPKRGVHNWYLEKYPILRRLNDPLEASIQVVAFSFNALTGHYDYSILVTVNSPQLVEKIRNEIHLSDEGTELKWIDSACSGDDILAITDGPWGGEALLTLARSLEVLQRQFPSSVARLGLQCELLS